MSPMPYNGFCRSSCWMRCGAVKLENFSEVLYMLTETKAQSRHKLTLLAAYFAVYFIWGSTYLAIRFSLETLPPFLTGALRFLLAGILLYGIASLRSPALRGGDGNSRSKAVFSPFSSVLGDSPTPSASFPPPLLLSLSRSRPSGSLFLIGSFLRDAAPLALNWWLFSSVSWVASSSLPEIQTHDGM